MVVGAVPRRLARPAHVGRERELEAAVAALRDPPALVLVEGEAGIGKTRLVNECLGTPWMRDRRVVLTACPPLPEPLPMGPIVAGLRGRRPRIDDLGLSPLAGALRPLFPEWTDDLPPALEPLGDPTDTRQRLHAAIAELLDKLGTELLVVEDAQWADISTMEFLLLLSAQPAPAMSLVVTYRPEDVPPASLLRQLTSRSPLGMKLTRVELEPLTAAEVGRLVGSMLEAEQISDEFVTLLHDRTAGLPLALEESVLLLTDRRDVFRRGGEWARRTVDRLRVPATVRDLVLERVARQGTEARRVLDASAVLAEPASAPVLAAAAALDEGEFQRGLAAALASRLLREASPGRYVFRHVLALLAVYEAIPVSQRRQLHGRAARRLEQVEPQPVVQLARHFREAYEIEPWARYGEAAADVAVESGDDQAAVALLQELLAAASYPPDLHARLARKLAQAATVGTTAHGEMGERVAESLRAAIARDDLTPADRGQLRLLFGRLLMLRVDLNAAFTEFERAVPDLADSPALAARAMIALSWPWLGGRPVDEHRAWLSQAATLLPRLPPTAERIALTADHATALLMLGEDAGWQAAAELSTWADTPAARRELARGYSNVSQVALAWGRYGQAGELLRVAMELADSANYPLMRPFLRITEANLRYCTGAWSGLGATAAELAAAEDAPLNRLEARMIQGLLALAAGDTHTAAQALDEVVAGYQTAGLADDPLTAVAALARLQLTRGNVEDALATTGPGMSTIATTGNWLWATDLVPVRVDALVQAGAVDRAEVLVRQFTGWLAGRQAPAPAAAHATCQAILAEGRGEPSRAAARFAQAARAWAALPRPYESLLNAEGQGRAMLAAGETAEALAVLADVQRRLLELGARWDADRVASVLRAHDVEVKRTWRGGRHGYGDELSPREVEVLRLVVAGMTNRKVAEALFISPRTVAAHVSTAKRKLGVTSRTGLAAAAMRLGIVADGTD